VGGVTASSVHVLHVAQPTEYGVGRYVGDLVGAQVAAGWAVTVACPPDGPLSHTVTEHGARFVPWEATRGPGPAVRHEVARLRQLVATDDPDVVHLHSSKAGLAGRAALRRSRPTIFQPHAWSFLAGPSPVRALSRQWERRASKWCDAIVCGSRGEQQHGVRAGIEAPWHVVPNAIDLTRFPAAGPAERHDARRRCGLAERPTVVCVGRLCPQKGQDVLLDAWPAVLAALPTAQLLLVGDGPDRSAIEARSLPGVHLVGHQRDVTPWLWAADVVVQPSRYETMALSMLEAMASARTVVAADIEGAREALGPEAGRVAGALVTPGDPAGLSVSLTRRLTDPDLAAAEGRVGRQRVEARYHTESVRAGLERVVEHVLARRARAQPPYHVETLTGKRDR
jgi:glycosyltransferase involved in cell wall biosynthesis